MVHVARRSLALSCAALLAAPTSSVGGAGAYTVVPTGDLAAKRARLAALDPDSSDPYVYGERAQLGYDIDAIERNSDFVALTKTGLLQDSARFLQRLTLPVRNLDAAVAFWTNGVGALVQSSRRTADGANATVLSFGPQSFNRDDGAKFSLELVESATAPPTYADATTALEYVQLAIPVFRLSQVMAYGGVIESAYGYTKLVAPGGLPLRVRIDETRRDPFEFVAMRSANTKASLRYYESLGMVAGTPKAPLRLQLGKSNSLFEDSDAMEPERELGSVLLSYGDAERTMGVLVLPPLTRRGAQTAVGGAKGAPELRVVGRFDGVVEGGSAASSPEGVVVSSESFGAFEGRVSREASESSGVSLVGVPSSIMTN